MADNDEFEFITRLKYFGLNDKEARLYHHLLKYGAQPPAVITRHMKTYREDVHRTLNVLVEKGVVAKSLSAPTVYVALPPETAIDGVVAQRKVRQRQLVTQKRELVELGEAMATDSAPPASADGCRYRVLRGPNEADAVTTQLASDLTSEVSVLMPGPMLNVFYMTGQIDLVSDLMRRGGCARLITDISRANLKSARYAVECGAELRHVEPSGGIQFTVFDALKSLVLVRFDPVRFPLKDASVAFFLCESPTYARHLMFYYELVWEQAVDGAERIRALEESGS